MSCDFCGLFEKVGQRAHKKNPKLLLPVDKCRTHPVVKLHFTLGNNSFTVHGPEYYLELKKNYWKQMLIKIMDTRK